MLQTSEELTLDLGKKKKKTKKAVKIEEDSTSAVPDVEYDFEELKLDGKKKKRTPKVVDDDQVEVKSSTGLDIGIGAQNLIDANGDWPDYSFDEALSRVYQIMKDKNPGGNGSNEEKKKFFIKFPEVARAGTRKTAFSNFVEICRQMKREEKHVLQFLLVELGTTGSTDGSNCLIVRGRWQQKHFESVIKKYISLLEFFF